MFVFTIGTKYLFLFFFFLCMSSCCVCSLLSYWNFTTNRLLYPTICLSHKNGGIPLSALHKDTTSELASFFSTLFFAALRQAGKCVCFRGTLSVVFHACLIPRAIFRIALHQTKLPHSPTTQLTDL